MSPPHGGSIGLTRMVPKIACYPMDLTQRIKSWCKARYCILVNLTERDVAVIGDMFLHGQ